jgi:hypothetical protein
MNFLHWLCALAIFSGYTELTSDPVWVDGDLVGGDDPEAVATYIFFATDRPIENEEHLALLESYGWTKIARSEAEDRDGNIFRHAGW